MQNLRLHYRENAVFESGGAVLPYGPTPALGLTRMRVAFCTGSTDAKGAQERDSRRANPKYWFWRLRWLRVALGPMHGPRPGKTGPWPDAWPLARSCARERAYRAAL